MGRMKTATYIPSPPSSDHQDHQDHVMRDPIDEVDVSNLIVQVPRSTLLDFQGSNIELRYLSFFRQCTAPVLSGFFDSNFWDSLLPLVADREPTIQHAMVAVAAIHEHTEAYGPDTFALFDCGSRMKSEIRLFAINQYNQAIESLFQRLTEESTEEVTLMCCVLFICLEFLRGNVRVAIAHLTSGTKILLDWRERMGISNSDEALDLSTDMSSIAGNLTHIFSRLTIQAFLCGRPPPTKRIGPPTNVEIPLSFTTLLEARICMDHLMKAALRFLRESGDFAHEAISVERDKMNITRTELVTRVNEWSRAFASYRLSNVNKVSNKDLRACKMLEILNMIATIWLDIALHCVETGFDKHMDEFERILDLSTEIINAQTPDMPSTSCNGQRMHSDPTPSAHEPSKYSHPSAAKPYSFQFEMGLIPPLYFVAVKCRSPIFRRRALALLARTTPRREGFWDANMIIAVAERVVEIEEECLSAFKGLAGWDDLEGDLSNTSRNFESLESESIYSLMADLRPPERYRIHDAIIHESNEEDISKNRRRITLLMRPDGRTGTWSMWDEVVLWYATFSQFLLPYLLHFIPPSILSCFQALLRVSPLLDQLSLTNQTNRVGGKRSWAMAPNNERKKIDNLELYKLRKQRFAPDGIDIITGTF
jgi:hypothetical protein